MCVCVYPHVTNDQKTHSSISTNESIVYYIDMIYLQQFFENINPLSDFDGKESLETYLYDQSQKVEPKDVDKWEQVVCVCNSMCTFSINYMSLEAITSAARTQIARH